MRESAAKFQPGSHNTHLGLRASLWCASCFSVFGGYLQYLAHASDDSLKRCLNVTPKYDEKCAHSGPAALQCEPWYHQAQCCQCVIGWNTSKKNEIHLASKTSCDHKNTESFSWPRTHIPHPSPDTASVTVWVESLVVSHRCGFYVQPTNFQGVWRSLCIWDHCPVRAVDLKWSQKIVITKSLRRIYTNTHKHTQEAVRGNGPFVLLTLMLVWLTSSTNRVSFSPALLSCSHP